MLNLNPKQKLVNKHINTGSSRNILIKMSKKDLPSYFVMFGACISIILLVAARHHPPSRQKIKEIWHGRVYWENSSQVSTASPDSPIKPETLDINTKLRATSKESSDKNNKYARLSSSPWTGSIYPSKGQVCKWTKFRRGVKSYPMCVHSQQDVVSEAIIGGGSWGDCNILSKLWDESIGKGDYIEIGGNIGACVMEMLTQTDANIKVFEPNPANLFCLTSTLERLPNELSKRVVIYPFALGDKSGVSKIYGAHHNMGNSVVGKIVKDNPEQIFEKGQDISIWRYDQVFPKSQLAKLVKMDAQGFECNIVRGMGTQTPPLIKTEIADHWLSANENCSDKILFNLFHKNDMIVYNNRMSEMKTPTASGVYDVIVKERTQTDTRSGYEKIYNLMKNARTKICSNTHILKGENSKEPDVHICLDNITPPCTVYSFGIAYNWIFDDFMVSKGCDVFSFDPSMNVGKHSRSEHHLFEPIGIGAYSGTHKGKSTLYTGKKYTDKNNYQLLSLSDMMQRYGHEHVDIIRMDIESAEWDVLKQWNDDNLWKKMDQLLLEVHMWDKKKQEYYSDALSHIPMALFHKAKNNWNNNRIFKDMTQVYELGFMNLDKNIDKKRQKMLSTAPKLWDKKDHNQIRV